jgi:hypothetical protein
VPVQKSFAHCDGDHQQMEFTAGCSAESINQYMEIQTKDCLATLPKSIFNSTKESEATNCSMVTGLTILTNI